MTADAHFFPKTDRPISSLFNLCNISQQQAELLFSLLGLELKGLRSFFDLDSFFKVVVSDSRSRKIWCTVAMKAALVDPLGLYANWSVSWSEGIEGNEQ